jgi:UDP-glucose 4-epimerase
MKILILGSEGFIGHNLVQYFLNGNASVYGCDLFEVPSNAYNYRKISRLSPELDEVFATASFDVCINAAGSGNVNYSMTHPFSDFEANSLDTIRVLECIRRLQPVCRYVHISSAAVYGNPEKLPVKEQDRKSPLSPYGWNKLISEMLCSEYSSIYKLKTISVRPFSVYGPGLRKQLFWDLFRKINSLKENKIELWGTGNESRDFIFIDDLVSCIGMLIDNAEMAGEVYNIASGNETTIREIGTLFCRSIIPRIEIEFNQKVREGDPLNWKADISKIEEIGFKPRVTVNEGINKLVQWILSQN